MNLEPLMKISPDPSLDRHLELLLQARLHDPYCCLGAHRDGADWVVRVYNPAATQAWIETAAGWMPLAAVRAPGLFERRDRVPPTRPWRVRFREDTGMREMFDPYAFPPEISDHDLFLFNAGRLYEAWRTLGAHFTERNGVPGTRFAVWAPNAERVSVVGDFNRWDGRVHPMASHGASGVWELFLPEISHGTLYKFEIRNRDSGGVAPKTDPYGRWFELRPGTAARVASASPYSWKDDAWMAERARCDWLHAPFNVYEVHAGSWRRHGNGKPMNYRELAEALVPYARDMAYTHIELLPVTEHPLDESWGYQTTGYFAPTSRYGEPDDLRSFVDACHRAGLGVILDWVPGHFPQDDFALASFDGTALYEHEDPRRGLHREWGTQAFNYGRREVRGFLLSSAHYWLSEFHLDGLRVDAVASMLYLDYSREEGEWLPNKYGGRENLEAIDFLRELNALVHRDFPGALSIAEESTAWPMVSRPAYVGGLGFSMKWNMGWMHDTLTYLGQDPVHRRYHHDQLTFAQLYAYTENFLLPLSHDEVVHGKRSLLDKMPGDPWQKFANLRLLFAYQMTSPGKKLNFMGNEFAQGREWRAHGELDWDLLGREQHHGMRRMVRDLNDIYRRVAALHDLDFSPDGFAWIDCHDADQSVLAYLRRARDGSALAVALNFTPVPRHRYRIGVPRPGAYRELFNSDSHFYGGSDVGNVGVVRAAAAPLMGQPYSLELTLPPLGALILAIPAD
jgi:1,4-alpha-glucan branching enzyme